MVDLGPTLVAADSARWPLRQSHSRPEAPECRSRMRSSYCRHEWDQPTETIPSSNHATGHRSSGDLLKGSVLRGPFRCCSSRAAASSTRSAISLCVSLFRSCSSMTSFAILNSSSRDSHARLTSGACNSSRGKPRVFSGDNVRRLVSHVATPSDANELVPLIDQVRENVGSVTRVSADGGYANAGESEKTAGRTPVAPGPWSRRSGSSRKRWVSVSSICVESKRSQATGIWRVSPTI